MSLALLALLPQLISAGLATAAEIRALMASSAPGMTDAELNAVLDMVIASAAQHKALADKDAQPAA
jgi:hypothetical protein